MVLGIDPMTLCLLGKNSTTELYPQLLFTVVTFSLPSHIVLFVRNVQPTLKE